MPIRQRLTAPAAGKQAATRTFRNTANPSAKIRNVVELTSDDPDHAKDFADALKKLSQQICALHLQQKALFDFKWDYPEPSGSTSFSEDFDSAHKAMEELEGEIHAGIKRQRARLADLELRATLLQAKLGFKGAVVPRG